MEGRAMFDVEKNINDWKTNLLASGSMLENDVLELESHLRDQIIDLQEKELSDQEAFWVAQNRIGNADGIKTEFKKVNGSTLWMERLAWILSGIIGLYILTYATELLGNLFFLLGSYLDLAINIKLMLIVIFKGIVYLFVFTGILSLLMRKINIFVNLLKNVFDHIRKHILAYCIGFPFILIQDGLFMPLVVRFIKFNEYNIYTIYNQIVLFSSGFIAMILMIVFAVKVRKRAAA
jgi:hypothetical protein